MANKYVVYEDLYMDADIVAEFKSRPEAVEYVKKNQRRYDNDLWISKE